MIAYCVVLTRVISNWIVLSNVVVGYQRIMAPGMLTVAVNVTEESTSRSAVVGDTCNVILSSSAVKTSVKLIIQNTQGIS